MWGQIIKIIFNIMKFLNDENFVLSTLIFSPNLTEEGRIFFEYTNYFLIIFIPAIIMFSFCVFIILAKILTNLGTIWYFFVPLFFVSIVFYYFPQIMLIFFVFTSVFLLNMSFAPFFQRWISSKLSSLNLINFLNEINLLPFFFRLFSFVFYVSSARNFALILISIHLLSLCYIIFSRFVVFFMFVMPIIFPKLVLILLFTGIFIGLVATLLRLLINVSVVLFYTVNVVRPSLWDDFLLTEPQFDPQKNPPLNNGGWFNRYNFNFNNNQNMIPPRISPWKYAGYGIGICALGVSCVVAYYTYKTYLVAENNYGETKRMADAAVRSADAAVRSADAAVRSADAAEVSAGLMTPDEFKTKWGMPPTKK